MAGAAAHPPQADALLKAAARMRTESSAAEEFVGELARSAPDSFFCGCAEALDHDKYSIAAIVHGGTKRPLGVTFRSGEGFLGQACVIGECLQWHRIGADPRSQFFIRHGIKPEHLYCVPIKTAEGAVNGLIFFGSVDPDNDLAAMEWPVKLFAELYGFQRSLQRLEGAYRKQNIYLSSLIEIAKLVHIIQDIRSLLTVLVDISVNLVEDARSSLLMFLFPGKTKANIVSRGITQEQAQQYCKELASRYFGLAAPIDEPRVADAPWGQTALECPISYRSEIRGVISVFVPESQRSDHYVSIFRAFMILTHMAIERAARSEAGNEAQRDIGLLFEALGEWDHERQRLLSQARLLAAEFAASFMPAQEDVALISSACLLTPYSIDFIERHFAAEGRLIGLLREYRDCLHAAGQSDQQPYSEACQIMALVFAYLYGAENLESVYRLQHIPLAMRESFAQFLMKRHTLQFEAPVGAEQAGASQSLDFDGLMERHHLSGREREVYELVVKGLSNRDIAETLFISEHTVKNHITNLFHKLQVGDRAQAIALAYSSQFGVRRTGQDNA
ncbi:hypothetical protein SD70_10200 [Gordoniibacillus kamchatkensis]|uniref:HTH luxR-type domain-containing protein n=1 Tax=Gordoniibacillus kamchatkensis TaxID=1590651 RepID=A0ABR5AJQ4_9BACL|nr:helix-turn-helix transcriptional regulator [Paenibacillus sp. VKM B-2647]KIL40983.1 hypothetical protein SD70_10200 [Paenibacillus sp. VKM B-2647]